MVGTMNNEKKVHFYDFLVALVLAGAVFCMAYHVLGLGDYGISTPLEYYGGDDFSEYVMMKTIGEEGWFWENSSLGAPYGKNTYDFPASFLQNFDRLIAKIIYIFVKDAISATTLYYLMIFSFSTISAYFVLRILGLSCGVSAIGSVTFGLAPYVFVRGISHLCLSACYLVPCSILLCIWSYEGENDYLKLGKGFFKNKRNIATIVLALLIANNGIGYYPIFTCLFLLVAAVGLGIKEKNFFAVNRPLKIIGLIFCFFVMALIPVLVFWMQNGSNPEVAVRGLQDMEQYGLKIMQLFLPTDGNGIPLVEAFITAYNAQAPLVNENSSAYLGLIGCLGFIASIILLFFRGNGENRDDERAFLLSRMNLCAVLYATIGGFSALIFTFFSMLRGFNRISIYIMFISICIVCIFLERCREALRKKTVIKRAICMLLVETVFAFGIVDQLPKVGANEQELKSFKTMSESDRQFVQIIENTLEPSDMVFQLPYHSWPESGPDKIMNDYQHFTGYLYSDEIKWSYGGARGRESDRWSRYVASLEYDEMIEQLVISGFRGIYIDSRAYTENELMNLCTGISKILDQDPIRSTNDLLYFYNLYPYIERHLEVLDKQALTMEEVDVLTEYPLLPSGSTIYFCGDNWNGSKYVSQGLAGNEGSHTWTIGHDLTIKFSLPEELREEELTFNLVYQNTFGQQEVAVFDSSEQLICEHTAEGADMIKIPVGEAKDGCVELNIKLPKATSPAEMGISTDNRVLALALTQAYITIEASVTEEGGTIP